MTDFLKNNPVAIRHCILFEVLQRTPIEEAYSKFCKTIGEDFMEYREFDFWYYRFINGEYDSNFEMDKDKKIYELTDMPIDVMEKIVENLNVFDRISLSRTSRSFQTFVEDQKLFLHTLKLDLQEDMATVSFGGSVNIKYEENYADCKKIFKNSVVNVQGVSYWKQAFLDLKQFLKNPKLHLETLHIESNVDNGHVFNDLEDAFKFIHHLNVKNLIIEENALGKLPNIIPSLNPGYLSTINIDIVDIFYLDCNSMEKVFEMEQWKQAKRFIMEKPCLFKMEVSCFLWPLHHLYHFEEFTVILKQLSVEDICQMKEVLFKSSRFERCSLKYGKYINMSIFEQEFGKALREHPYIYHYSIPNSTEYFEIKVQRQNFEVTRKKI